MREFDISIIIPIYNKEKYVEEALQSVLNQQEINMEIICIDDCSDDNSYSIASRMFPENENVVWVKNRQNIGVAKSRNKGMSIARGKYICFFDADDIYPNKNVLSTLFHTANKVSAEIVGGNFSDFSQNSYNDKYDAELCGYSFQKEGWVEWVNYQFEYGFTRFLFKREFLIQNNIFFPDLKRFQDPPFLVKALHTSKRFYAIDKIVYKYRLPENGVRWNEDKICDCIHGICWNMQFALNNKYYKLYELSKCRLVRLLKEELFISQNCENKKIKMAMKQVKMLNCTGFKYNYIERADLQTYNEIIDLYGGKDEFMLTIIVPAYNVEKYIGQCLDSMVNQTNQDFKLIIVNDGSTDNTEKICSKYVEMFSDKIMYFYQENKGLGAARNTGLSHVDTEYVAFLDSDDWQDIRFVEKFNELISRMDFEPDIIFSLPMCYNEVSKRVEDWMDKALFSRIFSEKIKTTEKILNIENCPELYQLEVNANRKIYRTNFLFENNFSFPEGVKWEDIRPHIELLHLAKSCVALADTGFVYRTNNFGQITSGRGAGRLDIINVFEDIISTMKHYDYSEDEQAYIMRLICKYSFWMIDMTDMDHIYDLLKGLHKIYLEIPEEMVNSHCNHIWEDIDNINKEKGLINFLKTEKYNQLIDYIDRQNIYRYWILNNGKKKNVISGGIQCIKDSGLKYTINLLLRKIFYQGFR